MLVRIEPKLDVCEGDRRVGKRIHLPDPEEGQRPTGGQVLVDLVGVQLGSELGEPPESKSRAATRRIFRKIAKKSLPPV